MLVLLAKISLLLCIMLFCGISCDGHELIACVFLGLSEQELMAELEVLKSADVDPNSGKLFAYSYHSQGDKLEVIKKFYDKFEEQLLVAPEKERIVQAFFTAFMQENALNPLVFPSLRFVLRSDGIYFYTLPPGMLIIKFCKLNFISNQKFKVLIFSRAIVTVLKFHIC